MRIAGLCFNWKVRVGLAVVGLGIWVMAPNLIGAAVPLLIIAACPLSMLFMMRGMQGGQSAAPRAQGPEPTSVPLTRAEQLAELKAQLVLAQTRQELIAEEVARLEAASAPAARSRGSGARGR